MQENRQVLPLINSFRMGLDRYSPPPLSPIKEEEVNLIPSPLPGEGEGEGVNVKGTGDAVLVNDHKEKIK